MSVRVSCPACGGPITFQTGSAIVAICPYCSSAVVRGDRGVEDLGKVAELVESDSPLEIGLHGRYQGVPFELLGRAQIAHPAGGMWEEWYAHFADGRWGWLAEAQGRFYLTFAVPTPTNLPAGGLQLGQVVRVSPEMPPLRVVELARGTPISAQGEIPYRLVPGEAYPYADLSGPNGEFATIDYSESAPLVFAGREVPYAELGFPPTARHAERELRHVAGVQLACPHCGGPLALLAPDRTQRVGCPHCGSLLDASQGELRFLSALATPMIEPVLQLGTKARFEEREFTIIGFLQRAVHIEGTDYFWEEYLLYHAEAGFRWLVRSDGHWSYVQPLPPGEASEGGRTAWYQGQRFRLYARNMARVTYVLGEFYWKIQVGEQVAFADYIHPPRQLSMEVTRDAEASEQSWSLATYLPVAELEQASGVHGLPRPEFGSVAPNQPFPYGAIYRYWAILSAAALLIGLAWQVIRHGESIFTQTYSVTGPQSSSEAIFTPHFDLGAHRNVCIAAEAEGLENSWIDIEGDLIDDDSGMVQPFSLPLEYYHGVEEGEAWSEGGRHSAIYLSAVPAGKYLMRLEFEWSPGHPPLSVTLKVSQGVARFAHLGIVLIILALVPLIVVVYHVYFERRRWEDSDFSPWHAGSS